MFALGIIALVIVIIITIIVAILESKESIKPGASYFLGVLMGILIFSGNILICYNANNKPEKTEFKYPTTEYTLEYEIISRGEQIDSTYVINKIE